MTLTYLQTGTLCRTLAVLLHAGIPLTEGLCLAAQEETGATEAVLQALLARVEQGAPLCEAMEAEGAFPGIVPGMVRIGEETGRLEEALTFLADWCQERCRTEQLLRSALTYPCAILGMMLVVIAVLLIQVLPVFDQVYASLGTRLTGTAAWLLYLGQGLKAALPLLGLILALVLILAGLLHRQEALRTRIRSRYLARYGDRGVNRKFNNARFARALAMGMGSGLPLEAAISLSAGLLGDVPGAARRCRDCLALLEQGRSLAQALSAAQLLSPPQIRLLQAGLRGGSADQVLAHTAQQLESDAQQSLETLISRVEPALVTLCALLVGLILLSVMLPLMDVLSALG